MGAVLSQLVDDPRNPFEELSDQRHKNRGHHRARHQFEHVAVELQRAHQVDPSPPRWARAGQGRVAHESIWAAKAMAAQVKEGWKFNVVARGINADTIGRAGQL